MALPYAIVAVAAAFLGLQFLELADQVREGDLDAFDARVLTWIAGHRSQPLTELFLAVTALGSSWVIGIVTVGVAGALALAGRGRMAAAVTAAVAGVPPLTIALKRTYARPRPDVVSPLVDTVSWAFPSGHTIASVTFFGTIAILVGFEVRRSAFRLFVAAYATGIGLLVATSRVYLGVHFPSDVLGGALIALAWVLVVVLVERVQARRAARRGTLAP